jgi:hypothetical protein
MRLTTLTIRFLVPVLLLGTHIATAQTADDLVEKHLAALGGRAALAKVTSRSTTGTMALTTPNGAVSGSIEILNQQPNKIRTLINLDLTSIGAGQLTRDQRFDGTVGYVIDSMQGNREITGNQLANMKSRSSKSVFNYKERGVTVVSLARKTEWAEPTLIYKPEVAQLCVSSSMRRLLTARIVEGRHPEVEGRADERPFRLPRGGWDQNSIYDQRVIGDSALHHRGDQGGTQHQG